MIFDQGEFNFDADGPEEGFRRWREELDEKRRSFEARWGVILSRKVSVKLRDFSKPLVGILEGSGVFAANGRKPPVFKLCNVEFSPSEIESIVQLSGEGEAC